jgi:small subunit ribosomal protein S20
VNQLPQIKSNIKTMEKDAVRHAKNSQVKSSVKTAIRRTVEAIAAGDADNVKTAFDKASSVIDSAKSKGVLHKNSAARKKSRLASKVNAMGK